jgi:RNA polymerase sigma-70 factor (ECF subfamily)
MATVVRMQSGDLGELVQTHQAGVWRYLRFLGCDPSQADDLTQETFLAIHARPFEERTPEATTGYLRTVARNLFLMSLRRAKRQAIVENLEVIEDVWRRYAADDGEAYREAMRDCVETLEGRAKAAIDLFYRDQRSRCDIARELEMTEDGVKSLLRRTREILRKCVEKKVGPEREV